VIYVRGAFPEALPGSAFVPLVPPVLLPFHLVTRDGARGAAGRAVIGAAEALATAE
jgi:hypothetical protein